MIDVICISYIVACVILVSVLLFKESRKVEKMKKELENVRHNRESD